MVKRIAQMVDRIKQVVDYTQMSTSAFADKIGIGRSNLTHIFSGRNQPSLDIARKILLAFPEINTEWLIMGMGEMFRDDIDLTEDSTTQSSIDELKPTNENQTLVQRSISMNDDISSGAQDDGSAVQKKKQLGLFDEVLDNDDSISVPEQQASARESEIDQNTDSIEKAPSETSLPKVSQKLQRQGNTAPIVSSTQTNTPKQLESHISSSYSRRSRISNSHVDKKITKIIFFYEDQTFDVYTPS